MKAENFGNEGCPWRDSAEHEEQTGAHRSFRRIWKERDSAQPDLLEKVVDRRNMVYAYKKVKANKGAPGIDGMTVEEAGNYLNKHYHELAETILKGKYSPQPVRRVEIPKPDGGVRKLGIPTVIDRTIQQAIAQVLTPIYEPVFSKGSYGYRPGRSAQDAITKVKEYAEQGYSYAVELDLSKYFDTLNHDLLLNLLRRSIRDERVVQMIKRYLKSGVMENGVVMDTKEGSPQGGNLSPLLANIYLNEFDQEFESRGVPCVRYADDIVLLARSERASKRLLDTSSAYLEGKLRLTVNRDKSKTVSVFSLRNFKFLGFAVGRRKGKIYIRVHAKSWQKFESKLRKLTSRKNVQSLIPALRQQEMAIRGWINYYGIADMRHHLSDTFRWVCHRMRACIWKQWRKPRTKMRHLLDLGVPRHWAFVAANSRKGDWFMTNTNTVKQAMSEERLIKWGVFDMVGYYRNVHVNC